MEGAAPEKQVQVRFKTRLPLELRVEESAFSLPAYLNRYGLSQIINTLLGLDKPRPFDFLVEGELIRTTLEDFYLSKNLSAETLLVIEYIPALGPPQLHSSETHDDWVSAVSGAVPSLILSGSYDGLVRLWSSAGACASVLEGHKDAVTSVVAVDSSGDALDVVSSSKDKTLRLWQVPKGKPGRKCKAVKVFEGHSASVQCCAARPPTRMIFSGSWDTTIKLWRTDEQESDDEEVNKKRKLEVESFRTKRQTTAAATYKEHTQCVSALEWPDDSVAFSASWDHSVRQWDVETGANVATLTCTKALFCLSVGEGSSLLVAGGSDPVLRLWDVRIPGTVRPTLQFSSHKSWISACKWRPGSGKHLLSASHDGTVKMWDIRSKVPLQTLEGHKDKILCADWWNTDRLVSGGADCQLKVFTYSDNEFL